MIFVSSILERKGGGTWTIAPDAKVIEALRCMAEKNVGALVVVEDGRIAGMISERDYARKIILKGLQSSDTPVRDIMSTHVIHVNPDATAEQCLALMDENNIRHLPVTSQGKLVGLVSIGDVSSAIIAERQGTIENIEIFLEAQRAD